MTVILLIRHGQNDYLSDRLAGRLPGVHLNEKGREQARRLGDMLADFPIKAIYASPLERAQETAEPIAKCQGLDVETMPELIEIDFGNWQGKEIDNLKEQALWNTVHERPSTIQFPDGEDYITAQDRVIVGLLSLGKKYDEENIIICVAHGDVIRLAVAYFLGVPLDNFHRIRISPASISVLHLNQNTSFLGQINWTEKFPQLSQ
jgi:probable phosphomutase (TIGR03848 family)